LVIAPHNGTGLAFIWDSRNSTTGIIYRTGEIVQKIAVFSTIIEDHKIDRRLLMQIAVIGLGRMGRNIAIRLARGGHHVIVYNRTPEKAFDLDRQEPGIVAVRALEEVAARLTLPRVVWIMVPAGESTDQIIDALLPVLSPDDVLIDGGNSNFNDTIKRIPKIEARGIHFIDVGTSGGIWGLTEGYSLMIGGRREIADRLVSIFETLAPAPDRGWGYMGANGAGHFVKMVHNGIEYGLMQAYAEGFEILKTKKEFNLDLRRVAEVWRSGSVVRSWLLDLISEALKNEREIESIRGWVADSGEGRWTVCEAVNQDVPAPVITLSLMMRFVSRQNEGFAAKLLAAMRYSFGGHEMKSKDSSE
jgi:6-phosphogluconate dehydrogenase